jgi:hypothetical protein
VADHRRHRGDPSGPEPMRTLDDRRGRSNAAAEALRGVPFSPLINGRRSARFPCARACGLGRGIFAREARADACSGSAPRCGLCSLWSGGSLQPDAASVAAGPAEPGTSTPAGAGCTCVGVRHGALVHHAKGGVALVGRVRRSGPRCAGRRTRHSRGCSVPVVADNRRLDAWGWEWSRY